MSDVELIVIMPVYNEETGLERVVTEWLRAFSDLNIKHRVLAINDGSTDSSLSILNKLQSQFPESLLVLNKSNSGHGRTCRVGYEWALAQGVPWIFQIDSDGQCDPGFFGEFWSSRQQADCIFGARVMREDGLPRKLVSTLCRLLIIISTGQDLGDPNVPYRLIERKTLEKALPRVPTEFDLQNIALALALKRDQSVRWQYVPIRFRLPNHGQRRIGLVKIVRRGFQMLIQLHTVKG